MWIGNDSQRLESIEYIYRTADEQSEMPEMLTGTQTDEAEVSKHENKVYEYREQLCGERWTGGAEGGSGAGGAGSKQTNKHDNKIKRAIKYCNHDWSKKLF